METLQIRHQNFNADIAKNKLPGIWNKSWVRPYESLWGIINTYKVVNNIKQHSVAMKNLGADVKIAIQSEYFLPYGIFCNLSSNKNDIDYIISNIVPEWYIPHLVPIMSIQNIKEFFTDKIMYCPECMKNGYHSILHQFKGIKKCPFHSDVSLISYSKQRYVLGKQAAYQEDNSNIARLNASVTREMWIKKIDFENISSLPFPTEWKTMPEIDEYFLHYGIRNDFDYIKPIGADINDKNIVPPIGKFLLNSTTMHNADIIIYNVEMSDRLIVKKMNERALKSGLEFYRNSDKNPSAFKYVYLEIIIAEMLKPYTADEIDYKCYQIERKKLISYGDELGTILLYFLFLTGNERIEECLSNIRETSDRITNYGLGYQYYFSELSIRDLELGELCISAQYYILEEYIDMNWKKFKNYIREIGGMTKPISRRNLILHPFDFIYTERNGTIRIYRIE